MIHSVLCVRYCALKHVSMSRTSKLLSSPLLNHDAENYVADMLLKSGGFTYPAMNHTTKITQRNGNAELKTVLSGSCSDPFVMQCFHKACKKYRHVLQHVAKMDATTRNTERSVVPKIKQIKGSSRK